MSFYFCVSIQCANQELNKKVSCACVFTHLYWAALALSSTSHYMYLQLLILFHMGTITYGYVPVNFCFISPAIRWAEDLGMLVRPGGSPEQFTDSIPRTMCSRGMYTSTWQKSLYVFISLLCIFFIYLAKMQCERLIQSTVTQACIFWLVPASFAQIKGENTVQIALRFAQTSWLC